MQSDMIIVHWIVSAFIAFLFGTISSWLAYQYQHKRDDVTWGREKEKIQDEFHLGLSRLKEEIKQDLYKQRELSVRTEILPAIWRNLVNTQGKIGIITARFKQYPDLNHMLDEQIDEFLKKSVLSEYHKKQLYQAPDKLAYYQNVTILYQLQ